MKLVPHFRNDRVSTFRRSALFFSGITIYCSILGALVGFQYFDIVWGDKSTGNFPVSLWTLWLQSIAFSVAIVVGIWILFVYRSIIVERKAARNFLENANNSNVGKLRKKNDLNPGVEWKDDPKWDDDDDGDCSDLRK